jgi:hypothetical protein
MNGKLARVFETKKKLHKFGNASLNDIVTTKKVLQKKQYSSHE